MEYVDGHSCAELLRDHGPMSPRDAVEILTQACRGLDYAHRNGVVHRDVKPGNLMVNTDGVVKLADFGIAKAAEQSDITKVGSVLGTAAYLSPEQARGEPAGPASDIYALGVVSYQLMAGRLPYEAASLTDLARLQESGPPPRLSDEVRDVPPTLSAAVSRALATRPGAPLRGRRRDGGRAARRPRGRRAHRGSRRDAPPARRRGHADARPHEHRPARAPPAAAGGRGPAPARAAPRPSRRQPAPQREKSGGAASGSRWSWSSLLIAGGAIAYQAVNSSRDKTVQLNRDVSGNVDDAVQSFKDLVADNTR